MPATFIAWCLIVGVLLIVIGITDTWRQNMPFSTSALYLGAGWLLGPQGLGFLQLSLQLQQPRMTHEEFEAYLEHVISTLIPT